VVKKDTERLKREKEDAIIRIGEKEEREKEGRCLERMGKRKEREEREVGRGGEVNETVRNQNILLLIMFYE
jgi:hypothetical protein